MSPLLNRLRLSSVAVVLLLPAFSPSGVQAQSTTDQQTQHPSEGAQEPASGGVNTGAPHPAVLDLEKRPITAGGFVKTGPVLFEDASEKSGLATWHHIMGTPDKAYILEAIGSGVG